MELVLTRSSCNRGPGVGCNTGTMEQIRMHVWVKRANCDIQEPQLACDISIVIKSISNRKSIFKDGHDKYTFLHKAGTNWPN